jgi:hypothetical protein
MQYLRLAVLWAAGLGASGAAVSRADSGVRNGDFEATGDGEVCHAVAGWKTYGAPRTKVALDAATESGEGLALRSAGAKAFCYGMPVDPSKSYVLQFRVRADGARATLDSSQALPAVLPKPLESDQFEWSEIRLPFPARAWPPGTREVWISLGGEPTRPGGAAWFDDVTFEPADGGPNAVPNSGFDEPVVEVAMPQGWALESGAADVAIDRDQPRAGVQSLRLTGRGMPCRISQALDLEPFLARGVKRIRVSGWGRSRSLGEDRVRLEVYGSEPPVRPFLSLSGDTDWVRGEVILDVSRQRDRRLALWIDAPRPFNGEAWIDDITIEAVADDAVVNLLDNPTFQQAMTNPRLPDYWGLWGDAVWCIEPWSLDYFGIADEAGPIAGARVLRVWHPPTSRFTPVPPSKSLSMFVLTGGNLSLPPGDYTFSIYAKAARPGTVVHIQHPASAPLATKKIGAEWTRITATAKDPKFLPAIHLPEPDSLVWLSAPQLEEGTAATPFTPAPGEASRPSGPKRDETAVADALRVRDKAPAPSVVASPAFQIYAEYDCYQDEPSARGRIEWAGAFPATVHWRLLSATSGEPFPGAAQTVELKARGQTSFEIPIAGLPVETIGLQAVVIGDGKKIGRGFDTFRKRSRSPHDSRVSRFTRSIELDGKPFLPIFLPMEPGKLGDWHLDRLVQSGFNCLAAAPGRLSQRQIIKDGLQPAQIAEIRSQLDRLHARGLKLLWPVSWTFDDWDANREIYQGDAAGLAATYQLVVSAFRDHPAIIGWYLIDEPSKQSWEETFGFAESDLRLLWATVKETDDTRPAYINWNHTWAIEPYGGIAATDIVGHDDYTTSGESFDWGCLVPAVQMVNDARAGRRPAFVWISGSYDELVLRPDAAAVRVHAWLHLIYGTRGLGYWSKPTLDPNVWAEIQRVNREATGLHQQVFGLPEASLAARGKLGTTVHYAMWSVADRGFLLCVNTANSPAPIEFDVQATCRQDVASARDLFDPGSVSLVDGVVKASIPPLGRRVYRFVLEPAP